MTVDYVSREESEKVMRRIAIAVSVLLGMLMLAGCDRETGYPSTDLEVIVFGICIVAGMATVGWMWYCMMRD